MKRLAHAGLAAALWMGISLPAQAARLGEGRDTTFAARLDGSEQRYVLALPEPFNPEQAHPLLLALHGCLADRWEYAQSTNDESRAVRDMAGKYDMIFASPDYRGPRSWMGPAAEADMLQLIQELKAHYKVSKVFLTGGSMGGFSTLAFTAMHPDLFSGICAQNAIVNLFEYDLWGEMIRISYGGTPREKPDEYKRRSAEYWPERFTMPVTLTTGGQDGMCPYYHVHAFANVLQRLGKKPLLIHRPLGRHSTTYADFAAEFDYMMMTINLRDGFALPQGQRNLLRGGGLFCEGLTPDVPANSGQREIGLKVLVTEDGRLTGVHFFKAPGEEATNHVLRLWNDAGQKALEIVSDNESVFGWQRIPLKAPYSVKKGQTYVISYTASAQYPDSPGFFEGPENPGSNKVIVKPVEKPGLTAQNGVYCFEIGQKAPDRTSYNMNYFVDADYVKE